MSEGNYLCEIDKCSKTASAFGLNGTQKLRSCDQHVSSLLIKQMTVYRIDRYEFIATQQDAVLFEERKALADKGLSNLVVQEANVDLEFTAALQLLEAEKAKLLRQVEYLFSEIHEVVTKRHSEVRQQLASLGVNLNQYLQRRENSLFSATELLCTDMKSTPSFIQLKFEGVSDEVALAIKEYWSISSGDIESILKNAVLMVSGLSSIEAATKSYSEGLEFERSQRWNEAENSFFQAKQCYQICAPQSIDAAKNLYSLGRLLIVMKRWDEALEYCRQAQAIFETSAPQSVEAAGNLANLGWIFFSLKSMGEAGNYCQRAKNVYEILHVADKNAAINLRNFGLVRYEERRYAEAEDLYQQSRCIFEKAASQSIDAAKNYYNIGLLYRTLNRWREAEDNILKAKRIYQAEVPQSDLLANWRSDYFDAVCGGAIWTLPKQ